MSTAGEIESSPTTGLETSDESSPLLSSPKSPSAPEVEINLYKRGRGPIAVFKSSLGGYEQDQLEVADILDNGGAVISVDGEPKDSVINPITKILVGVAVMTLVIVFVVREYPQWAQKFNFSGGTGSFPPWILALVMHTGVQACYVP
ncbi:hypothetical protein POM88_012117 [Heracleum sosnowskyi]|uniref:Uncharacterized protein n=1 Tax=Heracleum sosnowskyi TaxID=360622 RepID=A0AAD8N1Y1_9APIA|nr:hypothetical protein POM88_012117 [Heracleum sosnowskyi]